MKKIFTLLTALVLVGALQAQSYKVLNIHKNGEISQTIKLSDIDSLTVTEVGNEEPDTPVIPDNPSDTHGYVNLGLPSGTFWATYNVGADSPEDYGDYFAWGETVAKSNYNWDKYKYGSGGYEKFTKYCTDDDFGIVDNKTELEPSDDVATVKWGSDWCMPTMLQLEELREYCSWTWTTLNNVNGHLVVGPNGNSIFLPAAGWRRGSSLDFAGRCGYYWSSSLTSDYPCRAYYLSLTSGGTDCGNGRYNGLTVRPVRTSTR